LRRFAVELVVVLVGKDFGRWSLEEGFDLPLRYGLGIRVWALLKMMERREKSYGLTS